MKITTLLALSSVLVSGLVGPVSAHEHQGKEHVKTSEHIRVASLPEGKGAEHQGAMGSGKLGSQTACASALSPKALEMALENVLRKNPDLVMKVLEDQSLALAELVDRGAMMKVAKEENDRRLDELANPKVANIDMQRPVRGNPNAAITIVEYSDFECPFCEAAHTTIKNVLEQYGETVRFVYKHNPLSFHALAEPAARYFEAIALQNSQLSWEFHDRVFESQSELGAQGEEGLKAIALALPIDHSKLEQDLASPVVDERLAQDLEESQRFGFDGTPAFLVNGVSLMGNRPLGDFEDLIEFAMGEESEEAKIKVAEAHQGEE
ncbi:MAG: DsbA family protein [Nitrospirales bacterium]